MNRILVVEDQRSIQLLMREFLDKLGFEVELASNGAEALAACAHRIFDAILMDVQMPEMDGYQTAAKLREQLTGDRRTPILGLSWRDVSGDREAALAAGMDDYLTKPIDVDKLRAALARWLPADDIGVQEGGLRSP